MKIAAFRPISISELQKFGLFPLLMGPMLRVHPVPHHGKGSQGKKLDITVRLKRLLGC